VNAPAPSWIEAKAPRHPAELAPELLADLLGRVTERDIADAIDRSLLRPEPDDVFGHGCSPAKSGDSFFAEAPERALEAATGPFGTGTIHSSPGTPGGVMGR
jgi:hypothetical protein